jgi:ABC-type branched-subunit amino acid transport system substrate-binding protein
MTPLPPNDLSDVDTWDPPPPWWRRGSRVTAVAAALALVGTGLFVVLRPAGSGCAAGVAKVGPDHACVGLTDGSFAFSRDLSHVSHLIATENERVAKGGTPWVGVVYLLPMVPTGGTTTADSIRHEIEGAYSAQWEANHELGKGDAPQIRLLLAHPGTGSPQQQAYTLGQIESHRGSDHIVAVAGLGTSTQATVDAINRITADGLAAFGSVITADSLTPKHGLVRVAPTNTDEAKAAAAYLRSSFKDQPNAKVQLVKDSKSDDYYSSTLASQFTLSYQGGLLPHTMVYDSDDAAVATNFANQMPTLCESGPAAVFFAGRGIDLPEFLAPLSERLCTDRQLTVISGDDASQVEQSAGKADIVRALTKGNIRLLFTGLASDDAWAKAPQLFAPTAIAPFTAGGEFKNDFPNEELYDGQAIMGHDAVLTAVKAVRAVVSGGTPPDHVDGSAVTQMLTALYGKTAVSGASGQISLDENGNPENKPIPIVEIRQDGSVGVVAVSSATGQPPQAPTP